MDTIKILLSATIALLIGAIVLSWQRSQEEVKNTPPDQLTRIQQQIEELRREQDAISREKELRQLREVAADPPVTSGEREALKAELAAKEAELARIADEKAKAERDAQTFKEEAGEFGRRELEKSDSELRRARLISEALVMGKVKEFAEDPQFGSFVVFEVVMPEQVQQGTVLAVRRKTGVVGQIRVSEISADGAIGNILQGFGNFKPEPGDDLILPPDY